MLIRRAALAVIGLAAFAAAPARAQGAGETTTAASPPTAASAPATVTLPVPAMTAPLAFSAVPPSFNAGPIGTIYVDGVASGLALVQSNPTLLDRGALADVGNGQIFVQNTEGPLRFYVQAGAYALPAIGQTYTHAADTTDTWAKLFGPVPQAFIKVVPNDAFSIQVGKLPTLIGGEYTFTFENINIQRGLLWTQEPAVSRGVQVNYVKDPVAFSVSLNDGFYSGRYNWVSGSATWNINAANVLTAVAGANVGTTATSTPATPLAQNNSDIYNLIYTYTKGPLMVMPYLQYTVVAPHPSVAVARRASTYGAALLASYALTTSFSLGARLEVEGSSGAGGPLATNLMYGPGSDAASVTLTPTYTIGRWFARGDAAVVAVGHLAPGDGFGRNGDATTQLRGLLEIGYIF
jgi:hypothetical protein